MPSSKRGRAARRILVIHGPNLNLLGSRETHIYGARSLAQINRMIEREARILGVEAEVRQFNSEGDIVEAIQNSADRFDAIVINPAAYTHTSIAIADAVASTGLPTIEVHLSNIYRREAFRRRSFVAPVAVGQISGLGPEGYLLALRAAASLDAGKRPTGSSARRKK